MPPIHREKTIDKYCQESLGYGSDTDSSSSGSCHTIAAAATPAPVSSGSSFDFEMQEQQSRGAIDLGVASTSSVHPEDRFQTRFPGMSPFDFSFK